jgi:hypothetical protein
LVPNGTAHLAGRSKESTHNAQILYKSACRYFNSNIATICGLPFRLRPWHFFIDFINVGNFVVILVNL